MLSFDPITHQKSVPLHLFVVYVHVSCVVLISVACRHDCVADTGDPMSSQHGRNGVGNLGKRILCALTYFFLDLSVTLYFVYIGTSARMWLDFDTLRIYSVVCV